jgi:hypothetical protein
VSWRSEKVYVVSKRTFGISSGLFNKELIMMLTLLEFLILFREGLQLGLDLCHLWELTVLITCMLDQ